MTGSLFLWLHVFAGVVYLVWLATALNLSAWYFTIPFFVAELIALLATALFTATIRHPRTHRAEGLAPPVKELTLDVWITTCGEPAAVLEPTLAAAMRMSHRAKRVFVLDDADSPEVRSLAKRYGATYFCRHDGTNAKAGNLNHALALTRGDGSGLILTLDADQVPDADLMDRLGGYFRFPKVGLVVSAQRFLLPEGDPFNNADAVFYDVMQASKDTDNAAFSCGSGVVYRRAALEQIGGFSTWNLVEDVHTSMRLHEAGWRSVYHPYPLTTGSAPADIVGYAKQRTQWATDSLRLFLWDNPLRHRALTLAQRLQYLYIGAGYLVSAVVFPFYFGLPAWSMLTGLRLTTTSATTYILYRGVYLVLTLAAIAILQRPTHGLKAFRMWAGGFPLYLRALVAALGSRNKKPRYHVTSKVGAALTRGRSLGYVLPQLAVVASIIVSVPIGWYWHELPTDALIVNTLWALWVVWTLSSIIWAAAQPTYALTELFADGQPVSR